MLWCVGSDFTWWSMSKKNCPRYCFWRQFSFHTTSRSKMRLQPKIDTQMELWEKSCSSTIVLTLVGHFSSPNYFTFIMISSNKELQGRPARDMSLTICRSSLKGFFHFWPELLFSNIGNNSTFEIWLETIFKISNITFFVFLYE